MQTERAQPEGERIMPEIGNPCFRHYPFTLGYVDRGWIFLGLHRRSMIDYLFFLPIIGKVIVLLTIFPLFFTINVA